MTDDKDERSILSSLVNKGIINCSINSILDFGIMKLTPLS